jgi:hypothetical protein
MPSETPRIITTGYAERSFRQNIRVKKSLQTLGIRSLTRFATNSWSSRFSRNAPK